MPKRLKRLGTWIVLLIFGLTLPVRVQALVLCVEEDGTASFELARSLAKCAGCPKSEEQSGLNSLHLDSCDCKDISAAEELLTAKSKFASSIEFSILKQSAFSQSSFLRQLVSVAPTTDPPLIYRSPQLLRTVILLL